MTKRNLLVVSVFLVLGLVAMVPSALAQTQWNYGANQNQFMRAEGEAEATGQLTLTTTSVGTVGAGTEFIVYFTSQSFSGGNIASLSGSPINVTNAGTVLVTCNGTGASPWVGGCNGILGTPYLSANAISRTPVTSGPALHIPFAMPFAGAGEDSPSFVSITARVNVSPEYPKGGAVYAILSAYTPTGAPNFTITPYQPSSSLLVGSVQPDPALSVGWGVYCQSDDTMRCDQSSTAYVLLCLGVVHNSKQYERYFTVNVDENFTYALTSEAYENDLDSGSSSPGLVTNPTMITVVLNNIPSNFGISAGTPIPCSEVTAPGVPCPSGTLAVSLSGSNSYWNSTMGNSGTTSFEYTVDNVDNGFPENVNLPFKFYSKGPIGTQGLPCVTLTVYKQPADPPDSLSIPRFKAVPENGPLSAATGQQAYAMNVICFNNCTTNLLFPLVFSQGPWDTDVAISNTTMDPLASIGTNANPQNWLLINGSATPQSGVCYMYYYSGGALASSWITPLITAGDTYADDLQAGNRLPAFTTGYLWAYCTFSQAYGYAAIDYNFGLNNAILANYLAVTIPDPEWSPRDQNGDGMGENAITPVNLTRRLEKSLAGFSSQSILLGP